MIHSLLDPRSISLLATALLAPPLSIAGDFALKKGDLPRLPDGAWTVVVLPDKKIVHVRAYSPYLKTCRIGPEDDYILKRNAP